MCHVAAEGPPRRNKGPEKMSEGSDMNKQSHLAAWDMMRLRHGITLRLIEQFPADGLASHPIAGMRTPIEILVHMYLGAELIAGSVLTGSLVSGDEKAAVASITNREQLLAFVSKCWAAADKNAHAATDAQLAGMVSTPWGESYPGFAMFGFISDEYLHHRGQLYAYLRTFGIEPLMVWDFDHSAPEFQPKQHA